MTKVKYPPKNFIVSGNYTFGHQSIAQLISQGYISQSYVSNSFVFGVSRCPYQRAVSLYCYLKNVSLARLTSSISRSPTFLEYLQILNNRGFMPLGLGKLHWRQASNPQSAWFNELRIDQIIPLTNLEYSLHRLIHFNSSTQQEIITKNANKHTVWHRFYCKQSKQLVENLYQDDFKYSSFLDFDVPEKRLDLLEEEIELSSRFRSRIFQTIRGFADVLRLS